jgi:hypothetical protein
MTDNTDPNAANDLLSLIEADIANARGEALTARLLATAALHAMINGTPNKKAACDGLEQMLRDGVEGITAVGGDNRAATITKDTVAQRVTETMELLRNLNKVK